MLEEILKYLGIDPEKAKDSAGFKSQFTEKYYNKSVFDDQKSPEFRELFPKMIGKFAGKNTTKLQSKLKSLGIEVKDDEVKEKDFEDVLELSLSKVESEMKRVKEEGGKGSDQKYKDLEEKHTKLLTKIDDLDSALKTTKKTLEEKEASFTNEKKSWDKNQKKSDLYKSIKWNDEAKKDQYRQKGFISTLEEELDFDIDEKSQFVVHDKKTGKLIPNEKKNGEFLTPLEVVQSRAESANLWEKNPNASGKLAGQKEFSSSKANGNLGNSNQGGIFTEPGQQGSRPRAVSSKIKEE